MPDEPALSYCAAEIRRYDRDRFLTALFAPPDRRENLFALYAFNHEIAKTRESVSEPMVGRIRLQWWREALDGIEANEPRKHEVVEALYRAQQSGLEIDSLRPLIDAREFDLDETAPATLDELVTYARKTSGGLSRAAASLLDINDPETLEAVEHAGTAHAVVGLIRAIPFHSRDRRRFIPDDIIAESGAGLDDLFELRPSAELKTAISRIAKAGDELIRQARQTRTRQGRAAMPLLLLATVAASNLRRIAKAGYDPTSRAILTASPMLAASLWLRATIGRY
ncbi:MAG: phytoene/squalene synthase family protein [Rhodospirillales bacterium]